VQAAHGTHDAQVNGMRSLHSFAVAAISVAAMITAADCGGSRSPGSESCPGAQDLCGATCIDTTSDPANCGGCGKACGQGAPFCSGGSCVATCGGTTTQCAGGCVDTTSDDDNCGRCGRGCAINETCSMGQCVPGVCRGAACGQLCIDLASDPDNCGACGNMCPTSAPLCLGGTCASMCPTGLVLCGTHCVDVSKDPNHCGSCQNTCDTGVCTSGQCACATGEMMCAGVGGGGCVDTTTNPRHCGDCQTACTNAELCSNSACACRPGLVMSGQNCVDPNSDAAACGNPAQVCAGGTPDCQGGHCVAQCTQPDTACGTSCVDMQNDPLHCGACDQACNAGEMCVAGQCRAFQAEPTCTSCPCNQCGNGGGFGTCCPYPGDTSLITCVEGGACPQ
jgi:hypothetical protein